MPDQYTGCSPENEWCHAVYLHRLNWAVKFGPTESIVPFHTASNCRCKRTVAHYYCHDYPDWSCPVEADFGLEYSLQVIGRHTYVRLYLNEMASWYE